MNYPQNNAATNGDVAYDGGTASGWTWYVPGFRCATPAETPKPPRVHHQPFPKPMLQPSELRRPAGSIMRTRLARSAT